MCHTSVLVTRLSSTRGGNAWRGSVCCSHSASASKRLPPIVGETLRIQQLKTNANPAMSWKIGNATRLRTTIRATAATVAAAHAAAAVDVAYQRAGCEWCNSYHLLRQRTFVFGKFRAHLSIIVARSRCCRVVPSTLSSEHQHVIMTFTLPANGCVSCLSVPYWSHS